MVTSVRIAAALAVFCLVFPFDAIAQIRAIGKFKDWQVYTEKIGGDTVCFATTEAKDKAPKDVRHGPVHIFVASWKSGKAKNQPSLRVGYELRKDLPPSAKIGSNSWRMYAAGEEAFVEDRFEAPLGDVLLGAVVEQAAVVIEGRVHGFGPGDVGGVAPDQLLRIVDPRVGANRRLAPR